MKADYGALLHARGIGQRVRIHMRNVPVDHISLTDDAVITTVVNRVEEGIEYAVSFDFTEDAAVTLLARLSSSQLEEFQRAMDASHPQWRTYELSPPITVDLQATLQPLRSSPTETFAPLLVTAVE